MRREVPVISGEDLVKVLLKEGFVRERQKGSHVTMSKKEGARTFKTVVPMHKSLAKGTLRDILNQTGITKEDLLKLMTIVLGLNI